MTSSTRIEALLSNQHLRLLCGGEQFFAALIAAFDAASAWIQFETYIFDFHGVGTDIAEALERAAKRGLRVQVLVDGVGTDPLTPEWQQRFALAGVQWCVYSPLATRWMGLGLLEPMRWRRLHRKLCVVDQRLAFCGGINVLDDFYDPNFGKLDAPRFDFAVAVTGLLALDMSEAVALVWWRVQAGYSARQRHLSSAWEKFKAAGYGGRSSAASAGRPSATNPAAQAELVLRDNLRNRSSIEKVYLQAIAAASQEVLIANAYFLPGGKLRRALIAASRRGVKVTLLLQGKYEYFMQYYAARPVYDTLLQAGVAIHEYEASFLHAKVAVVDGQWATVGSSNLDPLSLLLAREANVVVRDAAFASELRGLLHSAMHGQGTPIDAQAHLRRPFHQRFLGKFAYALMRFGLWLTGKRY